MIGIDKLKDNLIGGGARANYFKVNINTPVGNLSEEQSFMIKAASLPASIISPIAVPFRGRTLQIAGDRSFEPWTITVINDNGMDIRNLFEQWMNQINSHVSNVSGDSAPTSYMADANVWQLDRTGTLGREYAFNGIWPSNISAIDLSYDSENTIEEFTVELQVTYWTSVATDRSGAAS